MLKQETKYTGLTSLVAAQRLKDIGANELASSKPRTVAAIAFDESNGIRDGEAISA